MGPAGYQLIQLLGRGGMGEVYLADDLTLGRKVAIKFLLADKTNDAHARRRLVREAKAAAALDHPNICTVFDTGETADGRVYVVMQYVEGETLASMLQRGPLAVRDALTLCTQLADALAAAHRQGIIHRDLKPANVMITPSGRPKLLDLGIAKVANATAVGDASTWSNVTAPGSLVGTPGYMSPEQVQQRPLDGRCDLFCLGVLLFECLTGRRAFDGSTTFETIANVLHVHPPAPSSIRPELTERHDELCRRLMAKDPNDRFQSADEVVGAVRLLAPDTSRTSVDTDRPPRRTWPAPAKLAVAVAAIAAIALTIWISRRPRALPTVSDDARKWYDLGTDAIREGSYFSGIKMLQQAVQESEDYVLAYARLAEAHAELDDQAQAKDHLLQVATLVPDESWLTEIERLRLQAVRALVLRDVDTAVALYRRLVDLVADESGAWLDLGRAQEAAGLRIAALGSYERAVNQDRNYAAAWLRLGTLLGLESKRKEALAAFKEAERLYQLTSNEEGEAEVLIRRGVLFDALVEPKLARVDLERALAIAERSKATYQHVHAQLALSSVTASDGNFEEAQRSAEAAVQQAIEHRLESVAAGGLVNLAGLVQSERPAEAAALLEKAIRLAETRDARRTVAWARLQLANVRQLQGRDDESVRIVESELPFLRTNRYRRFELYGLSIETRALQSLDRLDDARAIASNALSIAESVNDEAQQVLAGSNLASVLMALGAYPDALRIRQRIEPIRIRQEDRENLPYDFANRADLLIRMGRASEAEPVLSDLEGGIAKKVPAYVRVARRVAFLRALAAAAALRCDDAHRHVDFTRRESFADTAGVIGPAVGAFCEARSGRRAQSIGPLPADADPIIVRERHYWLAAAALEHKDASGALREVQAALTLLGQLSNDELRWRLAAVGAIAARALDDENRAAEFSATARSALDRVKSAWAQQFQTYDQRPDLIYLRKRSGLL
jgi:serine/threonine protein kinase